MTMAVWRGYCGTGGKPAGNREDIIDPKQPEKSIYSTLRRFVGLRYANPTYRIKPVLAIRRLG
jgi:hypothetical protein